MQGRLDEAISFDRTDPVAGDAETIDVAIIHAARGDMTAMQARLGDLPRTLREQTKAGGGAENNASAWLQLGTIEAIQGDKSAALRCAKRAIELLSGRGPNLNVARLYAWAGDKESALAELAQCFVEGESSSMSSKSMYPWRRDPNFFPLQGDPRFEALFNDPKNNAPLF